MWCPRFNLHQFLTTSFIELTKWVTTCPELSYIWSMTVSPISTLLTTLMILLTATLACSEGPEGKSSLEFFPWHACSSWPLSSRLPPSPGYSCPTFTCLPPIFSSTPVFKCPLVLHAHLSLAMNYPISPSPLWQSQCAPSLLWFPWFPSPFGIGYWLWWPLPLSWLQTQQTPWHPMSPSEIPRPLEITHIDFPAPPSPWESDYFAKSESKVPHLAALSPNFGRRTD